MAGRVLGKGEMSAAGNRPVLQDEVAGADVVPVWNPAAAHSVPSLRIVKSISQRNRAQEDHVGKRGPPSPAGQRPVVITCSRAASRWRRDPDWNRWHDALEYCIPIADR